MVSIDDFDVSVPIAHGGLGTIYRATDRRTGETVALKFLDPRFSDDAELVDRLFGERAVSERARHANLVDVRAAGRTADGVPYLVVEFLEGEDLGVLAERGPLELAAIVGIGHQIACGLAAMHDVGIVHCDLKPDNIFVMDARAVAGVPSIKIIDYGLAQVVGTVTARIAGTPASMAPEQWCGTATPATDSYALGCLLFELVTGTAVFQGTLAELQLSHERVHPARASWQRAGVPAMLDALIARALAKAPELRPSMREMIDALAELSPDRALSAVG